MTLRNSEFKLFNRGFKDTILLIPGWAADHRIFDHLNLDFNYLVPVKYSPFNFKEELLANIRDNGINKMSILGWSMGSFLASDFIGEYQDCVTGRVLMVSAREGYEKSAIEEIKVRLKKNKAGYLYKFYAECFCETEKETFHHFKKGLMKRYLAEMKIDSLLEGLDYLLGARITPRNLEKLDVTFIHGENDKIAPIEEALKIKKNLPQARFISLENAGHMPFFNPRFSNLVRSGNFETEKVIHE